MERDLTVGELGIIQPIFVINQYLEMLQQYVRLGAVEFVITSLGRFSGKASSRAKGQ